MSVVDLALAVGEGSLRASVALVVVLLLRRAFATRMSAVATRALLLAAVLAVPALPAMGAVAPDLTMALPGFLELPRTGSAELAAGSSAGPLRLVAWMAGIWLLGTGVMLVRLGTGLVTVHRRARAGGKLEEPAWLADRDRMAAALGLSRSPELRLDRLECVPHAWGWMRPVIVLPRSALSWSPSRRRAVLAHEIGHLARHEPVARVSAEIVRAIHWFDPLLRWCVAAFRRESELAADEAALALGVDARQYADHLVSLSGERLRPPSLRAVPGFIGPGELERRVERVLAAPSGAPRPRAGRSLARGAAPVMAVGLVALMSLPSLAPGGSPLDRWSTRYGIPVPLAAEILASAEREGIDPGVAFGLVAEESGFDAGRTSVRGAVGLTQLLPTTARRVQPGLTASDLRDDSVNLRIGFRYLRSQIEGQNGSVVDGLVAYALGPGRLARIRERGESLPLEYPDRVLAHLD